METDNSGTSVRTFGHLPFGETWYEPTGTDKLKFTSYENDSGVGETGLNYAAFRQHSSGLGRFMSADLLAGNLSAPQSLNRYAYAMNDPVNMVDPLGLWTVHWTCNLNTRRMSWDGGKTWEILWQTVDDCVFQFMPDLDEGGGGGGGGGGGPAGAKDDCHKFADMVEQIAKDILGKHPDDPFRDIKNFMDKLVQTFTDRTDATPTGLNTPSGNAYQRFGSTGFAAPYYEEDEITSDGTHHPSNQVRHAVAGLATGFALGESLGLFVMNHHENANDPIHGVPDINLNGQTVPMGGHIGAGQSGVTGKPGWGMEAAKGLANWIRNTLCAH